MEQLKQDNLKSLSFPTIGTGTLKYPPHFVAKTFIKNIMLFLKVHHSIQFDINIVVYESDFEILKAFENEILNFESEYSSEIKNFLKKNSREVDLIKEEKETAQAST